ncbi:hypothetical protein EVAR_49403_1 [Eumeta japonica]|uniref:Uncharacterized protein n=1 Tax=Eumeta variegata TaxID=151549 RepID=A0A4C1Y9E3_EUMVA|nr:hypothetical protein EVAR_49403_1 [Eumeta japonica]
MLVHPPLPRADDSERIPALCILKVHRVHTHRIARLAIYKQLKVLVENQCIITSLLIIPIPAIKYPVPFQEARSAPMVPMRLQMCVYSLLAYLLICSSSMQ